MKKTADALMTNGPVHQPVPIQVARGVTDHMQDTFDAMPVGEVVSVYSVAKRTQRLWSSARYTLRALAARGLIERTNNPERYLRVR